MIDATGETTAPAINRLRLWDAPVRLFHWALVVLIGALWWTGEERMFHWHRLAGYSILTLVLFRVLWGLFGSSTARFASFICGPVAVARYVRTGLFRQDANTHLGHNPIGGWSVMIMLVLLLAQALLGLFSVDIDGLESGPFSHLVEFDTGRLAAETHAWLFNILLALIALHVAAVLYYVVVKRDDLLMPMLSGVRRWSGDPPTLRFAPPSLAIITLAACGSLVWALVAFWGQV